MLGCKRDRVDVHAHYTHFLLVLRALLTQNSDVAEDQFFPSQAQWPAIVGTTGLFPRNPMKIDDIDFVNVRTSRNCLFSFARVL